MCGIHGIIHFNKVPKEELRSNMSAMLACAKHRGPDQQDIQIFDNAAIGTNRLSIIAPQEHSTIQSYPGDTHYALFNGEIVNHKTLRKLVSPVPANKHSDSALILPLFKEYGQDFIKKLAGMFAIAIYNEATHSLQLWRDPLGVKPLYYYHTSSMVIFSSEIKSIYAVMKKVPEVDFGAIDHCLRYRFHPGRSSVFSEIHRVLPGETVRIQHSKLIRKKYWNLHDNPTSSSSHLTVEEFRSLLTDTINEHAQADVKGGFFVSGGLDSSLVTAIALKQSAVYRQPISIKFLPNPVVDEGYGELLEKTLKTKFEWVTITDEIARQTLTELVAFIDEPLENPIHVGTYLMAKRARELGVKSVLTGDGSDEFFLGYQRHVCWFDPNANPTVEYPKWLWTLTPEDAHELYTSAAANAIYPMVDAFAHPIEPFVTTAQMLQFERLDRLSEYHNMRLDRMTMAHGVEAKVPFLDHRLISAALQIPLSALFGTSGKAWLQEVARPYVPSEILDRPKVHFPSLSDQWLSGEGAKFTAEILLDQSALTRKWIRSSVLEKYITQHANKTRQRGRLLWALLVLELWLQNLPAWRKYTKEY